MVKRLHIAVLVIALAALLIESIARQIREWPQFEIVTYVVLALGALQIRGISRECNLSKIPTGFATALTLIVFCAWTGGAPFTGSGALLKASVLIGLFFASWMASWWLCTKHHRRPSVGT